MPEYRKRIIEESVRKRLSYLGGVVIEGARAVGKTFTGTQLSQSQCRVDTEIELHPEMKEQPALLLEGATPRLIDEWQVLPIVWTLMRHEIDDRHEKGQFILTGSAVPQDMHTRHSGAGRISRVRMRPLTLFESGDSSGVVRFSNLLEGETSVKGGTTRDIRTVIDLIVKGGWPGVIHLSVSEAMTFVRGYVEELKRVDLNENSNSSRTRDPVRIDRVLRSLARTIAGSPTITTIATDVLGNEHPLSRDTVYDYLDVLRRIMVLEEVFSWQPRLRSSRSLREKSKLYFADPSIGPAVLNATPASLLLNLEYVGQLFENLVMRDVQVYAQACDAKVSYYRDSKGLEVDIIVEKGDGTWMAMEVKLGQTYLDDAAKNLLDLCKHVDLEHMGEPKALVIITSNGYAYKRPDGIVVVPIDMLCP